MSSPKPRPEGGAHRKRITRPLLPCGRKDRPNWAPRRAGRKSRPRRERTRCSATLAHAPQLPLRCPNAPWLLQDDSDDVCHVLGQQVLIQGGITFGSPCTDSELGMNTGGADGGDADALGADLTVERTG